MALSEQGRIDINDLINLHYDDIVTRQPGGWKISYRKVTGKRAAIGEQEACAPPVAMKKFPTK